MNLRPSPRQGGLRLTLGILPTRRPARPKYLLIVSFRSRIFSFPLLYKVSVKICFISISYPHHYILNNFRNNTMYRGLCVSVNKNFRNLAFLLLGLDRPGFEPRTSTMPTWRSYQTDLPAHYRRRSLVSVLVCQL